MDEPVTLEDLNEFFNEPTEAAITPQPEPTPPVETEAEPVKADSPVEQPEDKVGAPVISLLVEPETAVTPSEG